MTTARPSTRDRRTLDADDLGAKLSGRQAPRRLRSRSASRRHAISESW